VNEVVAGREARPLDHARRVDDLVHRRTVANDAEDRVASGLGHGVQIAVEQRRFRRRRAARRR